GHSLSKQQALWERAQQVLMGGGQGHKRPSPVPGYPTFATHGEGCRFFDADGNGYIDYLLSFGPITLGHNYPRVTEAVTRQAQLGTIFDIGTGLEIELAERLVQLIPSAELVTYCSTGSEATAAAVRIARGYTGREKIIRCGYHGWLDWCRPGDKGVPAAVSALTLAVPYNDLDALRDLFGADSGEIACLMIEPSPTEAPLEGYLAGVKALCEEHGAVFIMDEVKTGLRYALGGAQELFGVTPHLSAWSKGIANGYHFAAVVGQRAIMEPASDVWVAATFHGELTGCAAAMATLDEMQERDGVRLLWERGERLAEGLLGIMREASVEATMLGLGPMPLLRFGEGQEELSTRFYSECVRRGVYFSPGHVWFLCLSHTDEVIDETLNVAAESIRAAKA
ncbi:MAG: aspartate aminotransferase family protein, partial [Armatimonadetes bacterium]|nr:aspartate aminotransferase family protein [Armatimonadota bacterium]